MTAPPLLSVRALSVRIATRNGTIEAVDGLSFDVPCGGTLALVGESGSGKSMTALSLLGLLPAGIPAAVSGRAMFEGSDLLGLPEAALRQIRGRRIGMIFQDPAQALNPLMTVGAQVAEAVVAAGGQPGRVASLLEEVELSAVPDAARRYPHELSGGQQQRAMIAIALAGDPVLLIADEPTTALDVTVEARILELLHRLRARRDMSMILISHDFSVVRRLADAVVVLRQGRAVEQGAVRRVLSAPTAPYTRALLACRPRLERRVARLPTLEVPNPPPSAPRAGAPDASERPLLSVRNLTVRYPGRGFLAPPVTAAERVSLDVPRGGSLGLLGESGSGKSTVARAIVGLVRPTSGAVAIDGAPLTDTRRMPREMRRRIQYVFQDPFGALNPRMTVHRLIAEPMAVHGMAADDATIVGLLAEVGLGRQHLDRFPRELSGGQRQRLTIARALALKPDLLICDEIVSALDVSVQAQVLNLLSEVQAARGLSLLFISHDIAVVRHICDRIAVMSQGRIVESGSADAIIDQPREAYTRSLIGAAKAA